MRRFHWLKRLGLVILVVLLAACSAPQAAPTTTAVLSAPTAAAPTAPPTATSVPASPTPVNTPTEGPVVDACAACHTEKEQLVLTGKPEVEKEKESEGAG